MGTESKRALQHHLNVWSGASLTEDGISGPATYKALQSHLNKMTGAGLTVDGVWGPATVKALQTALNQGRFWVPRGSGRVSAGCCGSR